jgi:hypothetical protein
MISISAESAGNAGMRLLKIDQEVEKKRRNCCGWKFGFKQVNGQGQLLDL